MPDERESNRFSGRMRRYARVGGSMGGLAARVAGDRLFGRESDRTEMAVELTRVLGNLKGPVMKVAQILATIPEALPREFAAELAQLQSEAPPMGPAFVKRRMQAEGRTRLRLAGSLRGLRARGGACGIAGPGTPGPG